MHSPWNAFAFRYAAYCRLPGGTAALPMAGYGRGNAARGRPQLTQPDIEAMKNYEASVGLSGVAVEPGDQCGTLGGRQEGSGAAAGLSESAVARGRGGPKIFETSSFTSD